MLTLGTGLTVLIILLTTPSILYANHTAIGNIEVYHSQPLPAELRTTIESALERVSSSEIYDANMKHDLCLNDGSKYPALVESVLGSDVFAAFANKVVVLGKYEEAGKFRQWGQTLSFDQFLAHGLMHNYQYRYHGFFGANPLGNHVQWKWEGYVDYQVIGKHYDMDDLMTALESPKGNFDWLNFKNGESTIKMHVKYLTLVKYALESKGWSYQDLIASKVSMEDLELEMNQGLR
ncbi:hypothetical protein BFP97_08230 [Roseivirga sp. 4D4]|nr:hypothetical protein BFP97_08230 [Roseivirga sp. 4D4]